MEIRRLSYFVRVADDGSLTKAAGVLRVAQPALSRQIRLLEEELGVRLFTRTGYGMELTEEGAYLRASVAGHLRAIDLALQNVRSYASPIEGAFALGMPAGILDIVGVPLLDRMEADFPNIRLRLIEGRSGSLIDLLNRGIVDFAVLEDASRDARLNDQMLLTEQLMLVAARGSGLDATAPMPFAEVARRPLILPMHHLGIRSSIDDAVARTHATLNIRQEADANRLILDLVAAGRGDTLLPASQLPRGWRARFECCPVCDPELPLVTCFSTHRSHRAASGRIERAVFDSVMAVLTGHSIPA